MDVKLVNPIGPIGDFCGTVPATLALAAKAQAAGDHLTLFYQPCVNGLARLLPKRFDIELVPHHDTNGLARGSADGKIVADYIFDLGKAFHWCSAREVYQTRYYFLEAGLTVPDDTPRPEFELDESAKVDIDAEWGLAPFSRCLPPEQRWPQHLWQALVDVLPDRKFVLYGQEGVDDPSFVTGKNVVPFFAHTLEQALLSIRDLRHGLISVSTGPSHLAYAVKQHNLLLINQGAFCKNPEAHRIETFIPKIKVGEVRKAMRLRESRTTP